MAITKSVGRQTVLDAKVDFTHVDLETSVAVQTDKVLAAFDLPPSAIVVGGEIVVTTAFAGPTVANIDIGDSGLATRYATDVDLKTAARTALTLTGFKHVSSVVINARVTSTVAVSTAGAGYVTLRYIVDGRVTENV